MLPNAYAMNRLTNSIKGSKTFVHIGSDGSIDGYLSVLNTPQTVDVWLRGLGEPVTNDLLRFFVKKVWKRRRRKVLYLNSDPRFLLSITRNFSDPVANVQDVMVVHRGEEHLLASTPAVVRLTPKDALDYARLVLPDGFRITEAVLRRSRESLANDVAFGAFDDVQGKLAATGHAYARLPEVWVVSGVITHSRYRRRGYGTAVTSAVTKEALEKAESAVLYVDQRNTEAQRIYSRLGYRKIGESLCVKVNA
ncbi:MAG: GNAT family N-acetyltransferase [Nitrososphaerota archaeon]|nr:GNAT family N-acetyltransferase [Nitrososphaerota archaeon]